MPLDIVVGTQWGDEGKGRVVDLLGASADFVARYNGGDNAGHTVTVGPQTFRLHLIPSGLIHPRAIGVLGNGMVVNPTVLLREMETLEAAGIEITPERLRISYAAHLITPGHLALDRAQEEARGPSQLGTTLRGIGPAYTAKVSRRGIRFGDMLDPLRFSEELRNHIDQINHELTVLYRAEPLDPDRAVKEYAEYARKFFPYVADTSSILTDALKSGKRVIAEGAQGTLLDLDHGSYPYVTSSTPTAAGALTGLGLGAGYVENVIGVTKSFQTRVGSGPFPTELHGEHALHLRGTGDQPWDEFGTTTGRPRRVGWLDLVLLRYATRINGLTKLVLTKLDVLSGLDPLWICTGYRKAGRIFPHLPMGLGELSAYEPVYVELAGWKETLGQNREWEDLPPAARGYIQFLEEGTGVPVHLVSVGPEREQVVTVD
jgi:adenylosuccinate synthase